MLVDHADPAFDRIVRRREAHPLALDHDLALVGGVKAVEDVHQGRFAGPVLAQKGMDLAVPKVEVDVIVGEDARELLRDAAELEDGRLVHGRRFYAGKRVRRSTRDRLTLTPSVDD